MRKLWVIIKREYITRVRTKGFVIATISIPLLTAGVFGLSVLLATRQRSHTLNIATLDEACGLSAAIAYYGGGITAEEEIARQPQCPVMAHFGDQDHWIPMEGIEAFTKAHPEVTIGSYPFFDEKRGPNTNVVIRARNAEKLAAAKAAVEAMLARVRAAVQAG